MKYKLRLKMRIIVFSIAFLAASIRLFIALQDWRIGQYTEIQSYVFCVIFPATLLVLLDIMGETKTREGALMRFGSMLQLLLILCIPPFSLHLALGFPVIFFAVEVFSTKLPKVITQPIERAIIV